MPLRFACSATATSASSENSSSTSSNSKNLRYCLIERVLRLDEDADERFLIEVRHRADDREAADELGDEPELEQILGEYLADDAQRVTVGRHADVGVEADALLPDAALDDLLDARERPAADEEDVRRVDLDELLMWVLATALRWHRGRRTLEDLQQGLLHTLTGDVAGDRRVLALAGDLVDLVDVDDARLGLLHVVVGGLDELEEDVLDVLPDVAGFGERRCVGDGERHVQHPSERLREECLAAARWADQQDVRLRQLDIVVVGRTELHALVVVVHRDRQDLLRRLLPDDVVVQELVDLTRLGQVVELQLGRLGELFLDDLVAEVDALVTDVDAGAGDQLLDLLLRLAAERALQQLAPVTELGHRMPLPLDSIYPLTAAIGPSVVNPRALMTSSMMP